MSHDQLTRTDTPLPQQHAGTASLVLGITACSLLVSLGTMPILVPLAVPIGIAAVICGVISRRRVSLDPSVDHSRASTGILLGSVAGMVTLVVIGCFVWALNEAVQPSTGMAHSASFDGYSPSVGFA
jgi:uncharacterized membrane protein YedE/YeeE